ncbi:MAG TPA: immunoglobulin domain-containing protein, partial [Candidatus Sulfotelmatobacter sp.]|nr:immunoglobulin domain-containing protein [Candidatus Sulfotelmatobacter sp.]
LALKADGTVVAWGAFSPLTSVPAGLSNVIAISAGSSHNLALKSDGTVRAWGSSSLQTNVPAGLSNVVAVAAGLNRSLALKADGAVVTWGSQKPNALSGLSNVTAVAASWSRMEQSGFVVTLMGNGAPVWTVQPVSQAFRAGGTIQLHGRAVGRPPISYQWQRNGVELPGANAATLTLTNVQRTNTGVYRLVAGNALGRIISAPATLSLPYSNTLAAALNATNLIWTGGKTNPLWFAQIQESHDGEAAAQSGPILDNQQSVLQTTVTGPGTLRFWWKVSSEEGFDFLKFYLDNTLSPLASISGETGWEQRTVAIASGTHTLQWVYAKDASVSDGQDAGWVDEVVFAVPAPIITFHPVNQTRDMGGVAAFGVGVSGMGPMTFQWLRSGSELAGATRSALVLTNLTRHDAGNYAVAVINPGGSVTSSNALLVVRVPQLLSGARMLPDGSFEFVSGDADCGGLLPSDMTALEVQASTNLVDWVPVNNPLTLTNGTLRLHDPGTNYSRRFYRVVERQP